MLSKPSLSALALSVLIAGPALAQAPAQPPAPPAPMPAAGCTATPAQIAANKALGAEFFRPGITVDERLALLSDDYIQHNPVFVKRAQDDGVDTHEAFRRIMATPPAAPAPGPRPPAANNRFIVMGECDLVTIIRQIHRQDPTKPEGTFYPSYSFDTFRVRGGKLVEHWDNALIVAPAAR